MRRSGRLLRQLEAVALHAPNFRYVCTKCRGQSLPVTRQITSSLTLSRHYSSNNLPFSEKVRRKLWGTDNPPGLENPYGDDSVIDKKIRESEGHQAQHLNEPLGPETQELQAEEPQPVNADAMADYVPASTWDGLEHVGSLGEWWEKPPAENDQFVAFMHRDKVTADDGILTILHQVMVELNILKELNLPLESCCQVLEHEPQILDLISRVQVIPSSTPTESPKLIFPSEDAKLRLFRELQEPTGLDEVETESVQNTGDETELDTKISQPDNKEFLKIGFESPDFKFAYLKRASQLTGHRILDLELASISNPSSVFKAFSHSAKPKPKKLADQLIAEGLFDGLANVKIFDRRQTPIDKEKEVGRWKVIEEELTKRGLPVTGRGSP
ncbi:hypothetical protein FQN57_005576 [Myotisia sp. PD_48]|nr:hypothetical protein FQN57_005576 [Myotisia sp. PD_48]